MSSFLDLGGSSAVTRVGIVGDNFDNFLNVIQFEKLMIKAIQES